MNWIPDFTSPTTIVWRKIDKSRVDEDVNCQVSENGGSFTLDFQAVGFYKVTLNYTSSAGGSGRYLLMAQNNVSGYVSLSPWMSEVTIPAYINDLSGNVFKTTTVGGECINFIIKSCSSKKISYKNDDVLHFK